MCGERTEDVRRREERVSVVESEINEEEVGRIKFIRNKNVCVQLVGKPNPLGFSLIKPIVERLVGSIVDVVCRYIICSLEDKIGGGSQKVVVSARIGISPRTLAGMWTSYAVRSDLSGSPPEGAFGRPSTTGVARFSNTFVSTTATACSDIVRNAIRCRNQTELNPSTSRLHRHRRHRHLGLHR